MKAPSLNSFVIAGERSGVGKTLLTLAVAEALRARGNTVQCFKVGPDFIDPGFHSAVTGRISRNLDGWMMGRQACCRLFARCSADADCAVVEGVMGLYDGHGTEGEDGSTAQIAKWLRLPVILVIDGSSLARTAGAVVLGMQQFDPEVQFAGVIFNRVGSRRHAEMLARAVQERTGLPVLGYLPRSPAWSLPERHLGLVLAEEHTDLAATVRGLSQELCRTVDIEALARCRGAAPPATPESAGAPPAAATPAARIGIARDEAFCFYYQDNLDLLRACGAELVQFSPLRDSALPAGLDAVYLGGGYPELYAAHLEDNAGMRTAVRDFCRSGRPVYAECGGFLYLLEAITDHSGTRCAMAGVFPTEARMRPELQRLGYVEAEVSGACPFLPAGLKIRGHEFRYSDIQAMPAAIRRCYRVLRRRGGEPFAEGYCTGSVLAGYLHLHFASQPEFAQHFVAAAAAKRQHPTDVRGTAEA